MGIEHHPSLHSASCDDAQNLKKISKKATKISRLPVRPDELRQHARAIIKVAPFYPLSLNLKVDLMEHRSILGTKGSIKKPKATCE
jgi:hypothetical protein